MEIFLWIIGILIFAGGEYYFGYQSGKKKLRQDYQDNYKKVQLERDNYKARFNAYIEEQERVKEEKERKKVAKLLKKYPNTITPPPLDSFEKLTSKQILKLNTPPPLSKDQIDVKLEKHKEQTNSGCDHDYMGTLDPDVKICRKCPSKIRRVPWELGDSFAENWKEDK